MDEYLSQVKNSEQFQAQRDIWLKSMANNQTLKKLVVETLSILEQEKYTYQWDWLGIPIIKMPEEILLIQRAIHEFKPSAIIEIGVGRGGSLALYYSMQILNKIKPKVLGVDIKFFPHTQVALETYLKNGVFLYEGKSLSKGAIKTIKDFIEGENSIFVVLDGDHSHDNVLSELNFFDEILPSDSIILVADTYLENVDQTGVLRNWNRRQNPSTALKEFMSFKNWSFIESYCFRTVLGESPNGWIKKI